MLLIHHQVLDICPQIQDICPENEDEMLDVLFSKTRKRILELFFTNPDREYHLREVVRRTGSGRGAVASELKTLSEAGILTIERRANLSIYKANRESPVYAEIHGLVIKTSGIWHANY